MASSWSAAGLRCCGSRLFGLARRPVGAGGGLRAGLHSLDEKCRSQKRMSRVHALQGGLLTRARGRSRPDIISTRIEPFHDAGSPIGDAFAGVLRLATHNADQFIMAAVSPVSAVSRFSSRLRIARIRASLHAVRWSIRRGNAALHHAKCLRVAHGGAGG